MTTYEALSLMISFAVLVVSLISLIIALIKAILSGKKQSPLHSKHGDYFIITNVR
jgi:hypothetical protein